VFLGGFQHTPNVDAVKWLYNEIAPALYDKDLDIKFKILGSKMPQEIEKMDSDKFKCIGFVEDDVLAKYLCKAKIFIAPLRYGAGFKGKIAMAMNYGVPVVTTEIGSEGIGLTHEENAMIANNAEGIVSCIEKLYKDESLWNKISTNGLQHIKASFSIESAMKVMQKILE
jgi:glycosyltransferase involved in cell wall biosynthesis